MSAALIHIADPSVPGGWRPATAADFAGGGLTALGFEQITSLATSTPLTVPGGATVAVVQADVADVRWRPDGATNAPTASVGMLLPAGAERVFDGGLSAVRFIQTASGAVVNVSYYQ